MAEEENVQGVEEGLELDDKVLENVSGGVDADSEEDEGDVIICHGGNF